MTVSNAGYSWKSLLVLEAATLGAGAVVGFLTQQYSAFYDALTKPVFAPPGWLFPLAWTLLYAAMAFSAWLVLKTQCPDRYILLGLYIAQLVVNLIWPFLFFIRQTIGLAFFWLVFLWMLAFLMLSAFYKESRLAGLLLIPYQLWLTFAAVLNFTLARLNP